ncbi:hypothetical protein OsJ_25674 [Oryza sativa Japonica Group]|uniref:Sex determination protein tasselseed 2 n=1 Tax=Oryza sativa subsp. japonica TaxID=39947 RepID=B9FV06_ORYSJ|nr:hypothetical protein OsJ_25674 [Oryza sativa Japonica Group]
MTAVDLMPAADDDNNKQSSTGLLHHHQLPAAADNAILHNTRHPFISTTLANSFFNRSISARVIHSSICRRLEGKVAIVTGGSRGIGEAIVRAFVHHGALVVVADIDDAGGHALAAALGPHACTYVHCDVAEEADVERAVATTLEQHGRLDVLCNNAGVLGRQTRGAKSIASLDAAEFARVLRVNALGAALGMKHAARCHVGLTKNAACELGEHGIRVNCISPFGVATPMLVNAWRQGQGGDHADEDQAAASEEEEVEKMEEMVRRLATLKGPTLRAGDIAEAAVFLASDESRYVSGHNLVVDGGVTTSRNVIGL